jgi:AcrR family transcriptional regulator
VVVSTTDTSTTDTSVTEVPRRRRLEPDERREQILDCAIRMFGERPYAAVSTSDLAKDAGVARGLINHYFGTKRDLYLEVVRAMVGVPPMETVKLPTGSVRHRVGVSVEWLLKSIEAHGATWVAVTGSEGVGADPEVQRILDDADQAAAERVLEIVGITGEPNRDELIAMIRAYGGMAKSAGREWIVRGSLTRDQVGTMLTDLLVTLIAETFPKLR